MALILPIPMLNALFLDKKNELSIENITKEKLFTTDHIETYLNLFAYNTLHVSLNRLQTIAGKDGYLFLGNQYASILDKTQGIYPYTEAEIDKWIDGLKSLQEWYTSRGIKFIFVIAPNKSSIYLEKLPDSIIYAKGKTITDDIVKKSHKKGIALLDLRSLLAKHKSEGQLFYKTDTHWNNKGASIGYKESISFLNRFYGTAYILPKYHLEKTHAMSGDLANFLKIKEVLPNDYEVNYNFVFDNNPKICHGVIDAKDRNLKACTVSDNHIINIYAQDQYMTNSGATNSDKLLLIGDSFSTANSKPYNATFSTLWKIHHSRLHGKPLAKFIKKYKPDIVIYQIVEREIFLPSDVEKLD